MARGPVSPTTPTRSRIIAVVGGGEWVKEPVELGYWPWLVAVAKGAFSHQGYPGGTHEDVNEYVGAGFLDAVEDVRGSLQKFLSMITATAAKPENPPVAIFLQDGVPKEVTLGRG